jgi:hypothetical protein
MGLSALERISVNSESMDRLPNGERRGEIERTVDDLQ